ncbi:uncharacterized protein DUF4867 [Mobilisporobacter senegalensis]|uniref:Uncharacterized protein DUF4867 n=1 Tax=Mobilisporobacter senegalensis TaxID=1329262 RepID=A0A3N1XVS1_9FIRM|nr:DUF4867 family protein [Mobilisporobacter senegalensis]ROR30378.1 uncharacterized protein DUF4867 [Mobilisporobacter senegalensis]
MSLQIKKVEDDSFRKYGRIITEYDVTPLLKVMDSTPLPEDVIYVPSVEELEAFPVSKQFEDGMYGGLPIQIGYCNGHNHLLNAVEYHRNSEINIAVTDMILILGIQQEINDDFTYETNKMEAFLVPAGTVVELYATTLHYAPCGVEGKGFKGIVILPKGTNTDLSTQPVKTGEEALLFAKNKWLIGHKDSGLESVGAFIGLIGENLSV